MDIDWDEMVAKGVAALPEKFRKKIANVAILLEDQPDSEVWYKEKLTDDDMLLGYYHGVPLSERGDGYGVGPTLPDTITLYKKAIIKEAGKKPEEIQRVVTETIWHEFGHYFGLDEDDVEKREKIREKRKNEHT